MIRMIAFAVLLTAVPALSATNSAHAAEIVRYQLKDWKAKHIHDAKKAETITATLKKLGCELKRYQHNGHIDVKYRCPKWRELKLNSHEDASKWEKWLQEFQFKTEHRH